MEPIKFDSMRKATKSIGIGEGVIRYARNNGKDFIKRFEDKNMKEFFIKWCCFYALKIPHSTLKERPIWLNSAGTLNCSCGQTFNTSQTGKGTWSCECTKIL